jgi:glucose-6-phosphate isomerase
MPHFQAPLLRFDPSGAFLPKTGIAKKDFQALGPKLEELRKEMVETDMQLWRDKKWPAEKDPLDAAFFDLPERLLADYEKNGTQSEVGRIIATAKRLASQADRVAVLGIGGSYMGARAIMEACCPPYYNELDRAGRGGFPRIYFEGNNVDNDAAEGLLRLLGTTPARSVDDRWAVVVISKSGGTMETAVAFRLFLDALRKSCGGDAQQLAQLVVPVTGMKGSKLLEVTRQLGCSDLFEVPDGVGGRFSVLSAVGLLPAALMGVDIISLLNGAVAMNELFKTAPPGQNPVLDYVAAVHLLEQKRKINIRVMSVWSKALEAAGLWYDQLLAESLGKHERGATPLTAVNTRDLHSRAQQHQEGKRDKVMTNVIVEKPQRELLKIPQSDLNQDDLNRHAGKTLLDVMNAAIQGTNQAYREDGRPTLDLFLPTTDAATMGQFFQMFMLATVLEGRLMGINPYGQPGVEKYKQNMNRILRGE